MHFNISLKVRISGISSETMESCYKIKDLILNSVMQEIICNFLEKGF
jgi:hypothetical protein